MENETVKFNESEIVDVINKIKAGLPVEEACRLYCISEKRVHSWQISFPDGQVSIAEKIRLLEIEVARLNKKVVMLEQKHF